MKLEEMYIGQVVACTVAGQRFHAVVAGFHRTTGDPILRDFDNHGCRWVGSAANCEPMTAADLRYRDGIVSFA